MARTKVSNGGKGKEAAGSSRGGSKRRRREEEEEEAEESGSEYEESEGEESEEGEDESEEEQVNEGELIFDSDGLPDWKKQPMRLSKFPEKYQAQMFLKKIQASKQKKRALFLSEKLVKIEDFRRYGIEECFKRLGWMDFLKFTGSNEIYMDQILEWMSTLKKRNHGTTPETAELVGYVGEVEVVLSLETLKRISKYDTGATKRGPYIYPTDAELAVKKAKEEEWKSRIRSMFDVRGVANLANWPLRRKNLQAFPRMLLWFVVKNVIPRTSDLGKVRFCDVMVLAALLTGEPKLSARHLIMYNVWETREKVSRKMIPHARLLSKLLKHQGAIQKGVKGAKSKQMVVDTAMFTRGSGWVYVKTRTTHQMKIIGSGKQVECQRSDAEEEEEEVEVRRENVMEEGIEVNRERVGVNTEEVVTPPVTGPVVLGLPPEMRETPYYTYLHNSILAARPSDFSEWPNRDRIMFDRQSQQIAEGQVFQRAMMYRQEEMRNEDWVYQENIRRDQDFIRGYSQVVRPRPAEWGNPLLEPHAVSHRFPRYPQSTPSPYISPYPQQQDEGTSGPPGYDIAALQRSFYEFSLGSPYTPPDYDGSSTL